MINFNNYVDFIPREHVLVEFGVKLIGYFPYETATISSVVIPIERKIFRGIEQEAGIRDNKMVLIFESLTDGTAKNFLLQLKDNWARVGDYSQILGYMGTTLKLKVNDET